LLLARRKGWRAIAEPVIGHTKNEHRLEGNFLAHATGVAINAVGCHFRRLFSSLKLSLAWIVYML
jgi:hypothetical protein